MSLTGPGRATETAAEHFRVSRLRGEGVFELDLVVYLDPVRADLRDQWLQHSGGVDRTAADPDKAPAAPLVEP